MRKDNWKIKVNGKGTPVSEIIDKVWRSRGIENPEAFLNPVGNILPSTDLSNIEKYSANRSKRYDLPFAIRRESAKTAVWKEES